MPNLGPLRFHTLTRSSVLSKMHSRTGRWIPLRGNALVSWAARCPNCHRMHSATCSHPYIAGVHYRSQNCGAGYSCQGGRCQGTSAEQGSCRTCCSFPVFFVLISALSSWSVVSSQSSTSIACPFLAFVHDIRECSAGGSASPREAALRDGPGTVSTSVGSSQSACAHTQIRMSAMAGTHERNAELCTETWTSGPRLTSVLGARAGEEHCTQRQPEAE